MKTLEISEIWCQVSFDSDLWENESGLIVNTAALEEREMYFEVTRIPVPTPEVAAATRFQTGT